MSHHSLLFSGILASASPSPVKPLLTSAASAAALAKTYWGGADRELASQPAFLRDDLDYYPRLRLPEPSSRYSSSGAEDARHAAPLPDFSNLIPMYADRGGSADLDSRGGLIDLGFTNDWPASNMAAQYSSTFQRNSRMSGWPSPSDPHSLAETGSSHAAAAGSSVPRPFQEYGLYSPNSASAHSSSSSASSPASSSLLPPSSAPPPPPPPLSRRRAADQGGAAKKSCFHCHVTATPLWRREPATQRTLCNACGLYLQQRNKLRPQALIDADLPSSSDEPEIPDAEYTGPKCSRCLTRATSVWRRSKTTGAQVCNACGVYARLRGKERPLELRRNKVKPRTKHAR